MENYWGTGRTEAFSDGVFAIAITLLILEVNVPERRSTTSGGASPTSGPPTSPTPRASSRSAASGSLTTASSVACSPRNQRLMVINLLLLMVVSFLPFPTKLMAEAVHQSDAERAAVIFYGVTLLVIQSLLGALSGIGRARPSPAPAGGRRERDQGDHARSNADDRLLCRRDRARLSWHLSSPCTASSSSPSSPSSGRGAIAASGATRQLHNATAHRLADTAGRPPTPNLTRS